MKVTKLVRIVMLVIMLPGSCHYAFSQDLSWIKGLWKQESGMPYTVPPVKCSNVLEITAVSDSSFTGVQTTFFTNDTATRISYACAGFLTNNKAQFHRGNLVYQKNSSHAGYEWKDCANCDTHICSLYVEQYKIIIMLTTKDCDSMCNGTITYYRELKEFDTPMQQQLVNIYRRESYSNIYTAYSLRAANKQTNVVAQLNDSSATNTLLNNNIPAVLRERINKLEQTLTIASPNIEVILLDDAEIDGDIVTLYDNNVEVLSHKTLGKEVIKYSIKADKQHAYHELVLVAENLGSIPPNTALMRVRAGEKKYELTTRANMHENAKVIVEYTGD